MAPHFGRRDTHVRYFQRGHKQGEGGHARICPRGGEKLRPKAAYAPCGLLQIYLEVDIDPSVSPKNRQHGRSSASMCLFTRKRSKHFQKKVLGIGIAPMQLTMISNRGVRIWPEGQPETFCIEQYRCRFLKNNAPISAYEIGSCLKSCSLGGVGVRTKISTPSTASQATLPPKVEKRVSFRATFSGWSE